MRVCMLTGSASTFGCKAHPGGGSHGWGVCLGSTFLVRVYFLLWRCVLPGEAQTWVRLRVATFTDSPTCGARLLPALVIVALFAQTLMIRVILLIVILLI
jgi:hypothetical protein